MPARRGFRWDQGNSRLEVQVDGTIAARFDDTGSYLTIPDGGITITAGDVQVVAANLRMGASETFGTTQPTSAVVFKQGTAPAGAITTSSAIFTNGTLMRKIIADGTVSNIQT
jgi:hypothetical protein